MLIRRKNLFARIYLLRRYKVGWGEMEPGGEHHPKHVRFTLNKF